MGPDWDKKDTYKDERNQRNNPSPLTGTSHRNSTNCRTEDELKLAEQNGRDGAHGIGQDASVEGVPEIPKDAIALAVGQCVSHHPPLDRAAADGEDGGHERGEAAAARRVARVAQADGRDDGPAEDAADQDEGRIGLVTGLPCHEDVGQSHLGRVVDSR